jgi:hypothetical protein
MDKEVRQFDDILIDDDLYIGDIKTYDQAIAIKADVSKAAIIIEGQIEAAKDYFHANGRYENPEWFRRANQALKFKKFAMQRVSELCGKLSKKEKMDSHNERSDRLIAALRKHVGDAVFMSIVRQIDDD